MSGVSEMSLDDAAASDLLTSSDDVTIAASTVTFGITPSGLGGDSAAASLG